MDGCSGYSHSDVDIDSRGSGADDGKFFIDPEEVHTTLPLDVVIHSINGQRVTSSFREFSLVTG